MWRNFWNDWLIEDIFHSSRLNSIVSLSSFSNENSYQVLLHWGCRNKSRSLLHPRAVNILSVSVIRIIYTKTIVVFRYHNLYKKGSGKIDHVVSLYFSSDICVHAIESMIVRWIKSGVILFHFSNRSQFIRSRVSSDQIGSCLKHFILYIYL